MELFGVLFWVGDGHFSKSFLFLVDQSLKKGVGCGNIWVAEVLADVRK